MHADAKSLPLVRRLAIEDIGALLIYSPVVQTGSFSRAAHRLSVTPSTVSKNISTIEQRLGGRLVNRTTRRSCITGIGSRFDEHCVHIMQELEAAEAEIFELSQVPQGPLKITAPTVL